MAAVFRPANRPVRLVAAALVAERTVYIVKALVVEEKARKNKET